MAGRKTLRSIRMAREATNGTRVTPRYLWRGVGDWVVDEREVTKVEELVGISGGTDRTYIAKLKASMEIAETEATYKQLPALFYGLGLVARNGFGAFGTRTPSVFSSTGSIWRYGLNIPSTVFSTTPSYTIESGDNAEAQVAVYAVTEEVSLTFEAGEAAKVSANFLAQYGTRTNNDGSFSAAGTLENVTVILSSKTKAVDILPLSFARLINDSNALLRKVFAASSFAFAVGISGTIRFFNGTSWGAQTSGTSNGLNDVWGTTTSNVWAVGAGGTILFFNGTSWSAQTSGVATELIGVWGTSTTSVWAVGAAGVIRFYDGSTWASQSSGSTDDLNGVWASSATNVWAVGENGTILFYDGSTWSAQTSGTTDDLLAVWGTSATSVWAVGVNGTILFYNGSTWSAQTSGTTNALNDVWGTSATSVWAVGENSTILFYNGSTWTAQDSFLSGESIRGISGAGINTWAVGSNGNIWFWDGVKWTPINSFSDNALMGNVLNAEVTFKALWSPKYWVDGGVLFPGTMVLTGHEITGNITFEHQNGGSIAAAGTDGQIEKWRNQQAQVLNMLWTDTDSFGSEVAFGFRIPIKWDTFQEYNDMDGNNIVSGEFTSKYNETIGNRGFLVFHTGHDYSNIVGTV